MVTAGWSWSTKSPLTVAEKNVPDDKPILGLTEDAPRPAPQRRPDTLTRSPGSSPVIPSGGSTLETIVTGPPRGPVTPPTDAPYEVGGLAGEVACSSGASSATKAQVGSSPGSAGLEEVARPINGRSVPAPRLTSESEPLSLANGSGVSPVVPGLTPSWCEL